MDKIDQSALEELFRQVEVLSSTVSSLRASMSPAEGEAGPDEQELDAEASPKETETEGPISTGKPEGDKGSMAKKAAIAMISKRLG